MGQISDLDSSSSTGRQALPKDVRETYHRRWQSYARRRALALAAFAAWPGVCLGLSWISRDDLRLLLLSVPLMLLWLALAVALVWWQGEFRCPRCNRRYGALGNRRGQTNWTRGLFDAVCANCGLRKFEVVDDRFSE